MKIIYENIIARWFDVDIVDCCHELRNTISIRRTKSTGTWRKVTYELTTNIYCAHAIDPILYSFTNTYEKINTKGKKQMISLVGVKIFYTHIQHTYI